MGRIWAVSSGNGGTGKSTIALALAAGAAKNGQNAILLDASGISRSCDLVLGLESIVVLDVLDVLREQAGIESALYPVPHYDHLRFACASLYDHNIAASEFASVVLALNSLCDVLVIDLPTGACGLGQSILRIEDELICVIRPDDASIRAAERLLAQLPTSCRCSLVVNRMSKEKIRRSIHYTHESIQSMLDCPAIACIPEDSSIPIGEKQGRSAIECDGPAWNALDNLVRTLLCGI